jgi:hypothetical protein
MAKTAVGVPTSSFVYLHDSADADKMPKTHRVRTPSAYERFMKERDAILSKMSVTPASEEQTTEQHLSVAVFEAWADGVLDDDRLNEELSKYHEDVRECPRCSGNLEFYKKRRDGFCRTATK